MVAEIERPLAGVGMGAYQRMIDRRIVAHCRNRFTAAHPPAKDHAPAGDAALGLLRQGRMTQASGVATPPDGKNAPDMSQIGIRMRFMIAWKPCVDSKRQAITRPRLVRPNPTSASTSTLASSPGS